MKALFLSLLSILIIANCHAQIDNNLSVVSAVKMNVIYRGFPNPIAVAVPGYHKKDIIVTSSQGLLTKSDTPNTYNLFVPAEDTNKELELTISVKINNNETKVVGVHLYRVRNLPEPTIMLGSIYESGTYSSAIISSAIFVYTALKNLAFDGVKYIPVKYTIVYKPLVGEEKIMYGNGPAITEEMREVFSNVKSGDKIIIQDVVASGPNGFISLNQQLNLEVK